MVCWVVAAELRAVDEVTRAGFSNFVCVMFTVWVKPVVAICWIDFTLDLTGVEVLQSFGRRQESQWAHACSALVATLQLSWVALIITSGPIIVFSLWSDKGIVSQIILALNLAPFDFFLWFLLDAGLLARVSLIIATPWAAVDIFSRAVGCFSLHVIHASIFTFWIKDRLVLFCNELGPWCILLTDDFARLSVCGGRFYKTSLFTFVIWAVTT